MVSLTAIYSFVLNLFSVSNGSTDDDAAFASRTSSGGGDEGKERKSDKLSLTLIAHLAIFLLGLFIDGSVVYKLLGKPVKMRLQKPVALLVAHLAIVSVLFSVVDLFGTEEMVHFSNINNYWCSLLGYAKNVLFSAFSSNFGAISFQLLQSFRESLRKVPVGQLVQLIWIVSIACSIPTALKFNTEINSGYHAFQDCKKVEIYGSIAITTAYELVTFLLFHATVVAYSVYVLLKIQSNIGYMYQLSPLACENLRRKLRHIQLTHCYFIFFVVAWLPLGLWLFVFKVIKRVNTNDNDNDDNYSVPSRLMSLYIMLSPWIAYLFLKHKLSFNHDCFCCKLMRGRRKEKIPQRKQRRVEYVHTCPQKESTENNTFELSDLGADGRCKMRNSRRNINEFSRSARSKEYPPVFQTVAVRVERSGSLARIPEEESWEEDVSEEPMKWIDDDSANIIDDSKQIESSTTIF